MLVCWKCVVLYVENDSVGVDAEPSADVRSDDRLATVQQRFLVLHKFRVCGFIGILPDTCCTSKFEYV